ncbi:hypothetical protein BV25DRAFT_1384808 [Artomyces pyxidatus]|uniref:Uncharacterized protein n=1 Tax=Artomyces pyxidatus TaxID=48021 RepID=A0ACB8TDH8_9AGAM|nr:hypothetical protein BV25DRAFT_1384808 [Artomyces pyxidatus]
MSINNLALDDVQELVKRLTEDDTSSSTTHDDDIKEERPMGQAPVQKGEPSKPEPPATRRIKTSTVGAKPTALPNTSGPTPTPKHVPRSRPNPRGLHSGSVRRYGCRRGVLLDLDFATFFKRYWTLAGARFNDTVIGTPPFVSAELLDLRVTHKIQHDIESLLCVMIYMACVIEGPGLDRSDGAENLKVLRWKNGDATEMADAKRADMFPNLEKLTKEFTPYFKPLIPICNKIYNALFPEGSDAKRCKRVSFSEVTHDQIIEILDKAFYKMIREQEVTCKQPRRMTHESQNAKAAPGLKSAWRY